MFHVHVSYTDRKGSNRHNHALIASTCMSVSHEESIKTTTMWIGPELTKQPFHPKKKPYNRWESMDIDKIWTFDISSTNVHENPLKWWKDHNQTKNHRKFGNISVLGPSNWWCLNEMIWHIILIDVRILSASMPTSTQWDLVIGNQKLLSFQLNILFQLRY